jgi:selenocysteine lyase/cysteine desulfurase
MVKNAIQTLEKEGRCHNLSVALQLPCQRPEDIVAAVAAALRARRDAGDRRPLAAAVFSHLVSTPGIILPIADIARVCKAHGVQRVVVDAAHAIGQVKVRLSQLCEAGVDYYVTNVHKWLYGPKGTAVLMVKDPAGLRPIRPLIVSSEAARAANNRRQFDYIGTRDYTAYCAIPDALAFRMKLGDERILHYLHSLAQWAGHYLATLWATEIMTPDSMVAAMINVRLPTYDAGGVPRQALKNGEGALGIRVASLWGKDA